MADTHRQLRQVVLAGVVTIVVLAGGGWAATEWGDDERATEAAAAGEVGCGPTERVRVDARRHIDRGPITYDAAPPAFGDHRSRWEFGARPFYDVDDRPPVEVLVHNLEHGYNILWYDETVAADAEALAAVREIADEYASLGGEPDPATAFIAAPWTSEDGPAFPGDSRFALTHWHFDADDPDATRAEERGLTRYCTGITADHVREWMRDHPLRDAPEGFPDLM